MEPKRLNKFISDTGQWSRRDADQLILQGRVTVNGKLAEPGTKVNANDKVRVDDQILHVREEAPVFLLFNKPAGIAATTDLSVRNNIIAALNYPAALQPVGHLDRDAEGLMILCNDYELSRKLTKVDTQFEKEYQVTVNKMVTPEFLTRMSERGIPTPGQPRQKNQVSKTGPTRFRIGLEPGMSHHVKKMCEDLGFKVLHLQRTRLGDFSQVKLPAGMWRVLTQPEIDGLRNMVSGRAYKPKSTREKESFGREASPGPAAFTPGRKPATRTAGTPPTRRPAGETPPKKVASKSARPASRGGVPKGRNRQGAGPKGNSGRSR